MSKKVAVVSSSLWISFKSYISPDDNVYAHLRRWQEVIKVSVTQSSKACARNSTATYILLHEMKIEDLPLSKISMRWVHWEIGYVNMLPMPQKSDERYSITMNHDRDSSAVTTGGNCVSPKLYSVFFLVGIQAQIPSSGYHGSGKRSEITRPYSRTLRRPRCSRQ